MSTRARVIALLKEFFTKMEMDVEEGGDLDLSVRDGNNLVGVKVSLGPFVRRDVEQLIVEAPSLNYDKLYVAVPAKYVSMLPPLDVLHAAGIGVLEVSSDSVRILVYPRARGRIRERVAAANELLEVKRELDKLREELRSLKRAVSRIESLERRVAALEGQRLKSGAAAPKVEAAAERTGVEKVEGVPSFAADNPWLRILSRRGEEG